MKKIAAALALVTLCACDKQSNEQATQSETGAVSPTPTEDPAARPVEGDADAIWAELIGAWASVDACTDDLNRWIIEAERFSLYEMHCDLESLQLLENGVRATAQCAVEGDNDGIEDVFWFLRQGDGSLTVVQGDNNAMSSGLFPCPKGEGVEL
jgi:hypothetical protein